MKIVKSLSYGWLYFRICIISKTYTTSIFECYPTVVAAEKVKKNWI